MAGGPYNGYPWAWRIKILEALDREREQGRTYLRDRCDICEDRAAVLHSEDYSLPYTFSPPQTYSLCRPCHRRLHRRFNEPPEIWWLWLEHLKAGGYGAEFSEIYPARNRDRLVQLIALGGLDPIWRIRLRHIEGNEWWLHLSLDPATQFAAWARPRPLKARPTTTQYLNAIKEMGLSRLETELLLFHGNAGHRSVGMAELSQKAFASFGKVSAALVYRDLGRRLCDGMGWEPDSFRSGHQNWASVIAEPWRTECGETEWVLVEALNTLLGETGCKALVKC
jgi:hypothetical protein